MKGKINTIGTNMILLLLILIISLYLAPIIKNFEGFSNLYDLTSPGLYPKSVDKAILNDYPQIGKNKTSNDTYNTIWKDYPVLPLGSYDQQSNNLKYVKNPDNGTCVRADFCGAVYYDKKNTKSNIIKPLPPVEEGEGARVGYFRTEPNKLYFSIPTNETILY